MNQTADIKTVFSLDIRALAIFRILLAIALILDVLNRFAFIPAFFSDHGILPRHAVELGNFTHAYHFQLMMLSGSEWFSSLFLGVLLICSILLLIGYKTRWMTFICWLLFCSVIIRENLTSHAGDTLLIVLLFWAIFLPLGKVLSIDGYLKSDNRNTSDKNLFFSAATVALYIQVSILYITTGLFKAQHESWLDGTYLYNAFSRFDFVEPTAFLLYPFYDLLTYLTYFTLFFELFGPLLLFIPFFFVTFRMVAILLFIGFQISIGLTMDVGLFPLISSAGIIVFLPSQLFDFFAKKYPKTIRSIHEKSKDVIRSFMPQQKKSSHVSSIRWQLLSNYFVTAVISYVILWNIAEVSSKFSMPDWSKKPGYFFKLDQRWSMFSTTVTFAEYVALEVTYEDGETIDLMDELRVEYNSSPDFKHVGYINYRWRIFFSNRLTRHDYRGYRPLFTDYKISKSNISFYENSGIDSIKLVGYWYQIGEYYDHSELSQSILYELE